MGELSDKLKTDEEKISHFMINFAQKNNLVYSLIRCPTSLDFDEIDMDLYKRDNFKHSRAVIGIDFAVNRKGNLYYPTEGVHICDNKEKYQEKIKKFKGAWKRNFPEIKYSY